jgi:4-hydroxy-3-polyprenylbenzoate decarboxylase
MIRAQKMVKFKQDKRSNFSQMIVVAISGASGPIMGVRLIEELLNLKESVTAVVSQPAGRIIEYEILLGKEPFSSLRELIESRGVTKNIDLLNEYGNEDFFSPVASGSAQFEAVVVIPCSMKTLSAIVHGYADSLITRACDVALKEKRRCIVVPRETPLSVVHTENLHKAARAGIEIVPPMPGFYTRPESIVDVIDFVVGKILNLLGRKHHLFESWGK